MKKIITLLICLLVPTFLFADSEFEKWQKSQTEELGKEKEKYTAYIKEQDKEFVSYLKKEWENFKAHKELVKDSVPKPKKLPVLPEPKKEPVKKEKPKDKIPEKEIPKKKAPEKKIPPIIPKKETPKKKAPVIPEKPKCNESKIEFDFYGNKISLCLDKKIKNLSIDSINNKNIANFWEEISKTNYENLIKQIKTYKKDLVLNDWGYHMLFYKLGENLFENDKNLTKLFMWFCSVKTSYLTKAAYSDNNVIILFGYENNLYGAKYLTFKDKRFYALTFSDKKENFKSLKTYKQNYSKKIKSIKLDITNYPNFKEKAFKKKNITFSYNGKDYNLDIACNKYVVKYFKLYPQTDFNIYFDAKISKELKTNILEPISEIIKNENKKKSVAILLRLTQKAFEYKTDDEQFGYEKYLLPEETIFYPFSDCEDRSFFFSFLVKELLGIKVVGLHYPGHMATAILFDEKVEGDFVTYKNKKYIVCDPTYINADIGNAMPKFKKVKPKIIEIN